MKILEQATCDMLEKIAQLESSLINKSMEIDKIKGLAVLQNSLYEFKTSYLKKIYGEIVYSHCSEYRYLVIKILEDIKDEYKQDVLKELLIPKKQNMSNIELLSILRK